MAKRFMEIGGKEGGQGEDDSEKALRKGKQYQTRMLP